MISSKCAFTNSNGSVRVPGDFQAPKSSERILRGLELARNTACSAGRASAGSRKRAQRAEQPLPVAGGPVPLESRTRAVESARSSERRRPCESTASATSGYRLASCRAMRAPALRLRRSGLIAAPSDERHQGAGRNRRVSSSIAGLRHPAQLRGPLAESSRMNRW